jgi:hypothetical protein
LAWRIVGVLGSLAQPPIKTEMSGKMMLVVIP